MTLSPLEQIVFRFHHDLQSLVDRLNVIVDNRIIIAGEWERAKETCNDANDEYADQRVPFEYLPDGYDKLDDKTEDPDSGFTPKETANWEAVQRWHADCTSLLKSIVDSLMDTDDEADQLVSEFCKNRYSRFTVEAKQHSTILDRNEHPSESLYLSAGLCDKETDEYLYRLIEHRISRHDRPFDQQWSGGRKIPSLERYYLRNYKPPGLDLNLIRKYVAEEKARQAATHPDDHQPGPKMPKLADP